MAHRPVSRGEKFTVPKIPGFKSEAIEVMEAKRRKVPGSFHPWISQVGFVDIWDAQGYDYLAHPPLHVTWSG